MFFFRRPILFFLIICVNQISAKEEKYVSVLTCDELVDVTCNVYNITPIIVPDQVIRALGKAKTFKNISIERITFDSPNILNYVPTNVFYIFPSIQYFEMINVELKHLVINAFASCEKLETIFIGNNNFAHVSSGFAKKCGNLRNVSLPNNEIKTIHENALHKLNNLEALDLTNNSIVCIPPKLFKKSPNIFKINLSFNKISAINKITFQGLKNVNYINLESNQIAFIPALKFDDSSDNGGLELILSNNPIYAIEPTFIQNFFPWREVSESAWSSITIIMNDVVVADSCLSADIIIQNADTENANAQLGNCYGNWTVELAESSVICAVPDNLESSEMDDATLQAISNSLDETAAKTFRAGKSTEVGKQTKKLAKSTALKSVQKPLLRSGACKTDKACRYYLDYQKRYTCVIENVDSVITSLGGEHLDELYDDKSVSRVYVTQSSLFKIPNVIFEKFHNLKFLSVANASIGIVTDNTFQLCNNLTFLDLSHNNIIHVTKKAFKKCSKLKTVDLTGNPVDYLGLQFSQNLDTILLNRKDSQEWH